MEAQQRLGQVSLDDDLRIRISAVCGELDVDGLRGDIVTKPEIEDSLYAFGAEVESNAVEVYVSRLRKKLGRDFVETIRGLGYRVKA